MWEKILPFRRDLSLHRYGTTQERLGFNASNIILGEIPLTPKNRVENFNLLSSKQYIFTCLFQSRIPLLSGLICHNGMKYCINTVMQS